MRDVCVCVFFFSPRLTVCVTCLTVSGRLGARYCLNFYYRLRIFTVSVSLLFHCVYHKKRSSVEELHKLAGLEQLGERLFVK